jgi:hypothetical protein
LPGQTVPDHITERKVIWSFRRNRGAEANRSGRKRSLAVRKDGVGFSRSGKAGIIFEGRNGRMTIRFPAPTFAGTITAAHLISPRNAHILIPRKVSHQSIIP